MKFRNLQFYYYPLIIIIFFLSYLYINHNNNINDNESRVSGAKKALDFWTQLRAYPKKDIPADLFYKAFQIEKQKRISNKNNNHISLWEPMGPLNIPGRMISVAPHPTNPDIIYAGSASGGLWRGIKEIHSYKWTRIETGFPVLGVNAIAIDPIDPNIIYIGTGEVYGYKKSIGGTVIRTTRGSYGIGILKSIDSGKTWIKSLDWSLQQQKGVQCIRINPENSKSIYAATTEGIYKSIDAGLNWQCVLPIILGEDIIIYPADTSQIVVSCGNLGSDSSGIYYSTDAGSNWSKSENLPEYNGKTLLDIYKTTPKILYASVSDSLRGIGLYKSTNLGKNWFPVHTYDVPRYQGWFSHWVAIHPLDLNRIIHAGVEMHYSTNGGSLLNFSRNEPHVDHHNFAHDPFNPDRLYIACDGGIYVTDNFGESYQNISYGLQTAQFYNGTSSSPLDSMLAMGGLQDNNTAIYNGTQDWRTAIGGDGCWTAINSQNDNILYGEAQYNSISKSINRGFGFIEATDGMDDNAAFVAPFVISQSNPNILYSGRSKIYKTVNAAEAWTATNQNNPLDGNFALSMAISFKNPNVVYVGTAPGISRSHIFRTTDGGLNWEDVTRNLPDRYPMDIAIDPQNDKTVYAVFGGFGSGHVFKSTDKGNIWNDITGTLPDVPTLAIIVDPLNSDHLYIGNDLGVYASTDGGNTWNIFNSGLPEAVIAMDLNISPTNRKLRLATHGNGAYQIPLLYQFNAPYLQINADIFPNLTMVDKALRLNVTVKNWGTQTQSDPYYIKMRIIDNFNTEIFSFTDSVSNLNVLEEKTLQFDQVFVPQDTGQFKLDLIEIGDQQNHVNDTLRFEFNVIPTTTISKVKVTIKYSPYTEIKSIRKIYEGQPTKLDLPFNIVYDGYEYNKIQVTDHGWVEFGTGEDGTERGLSTDTQLSSDFGGSESGRITSVSRPSKVIAPWWGNLSRRIEQQRIFFGDVSYITEGINPFRVFVIQWKNMFASPYSTTNLNFQVRLYETSSLIEFHYGNLLVGTYSGSEAMVGLEDHIGGNFHFFDIIGEGAGLTRNAMLNLNPLTQWPGPDSVYVIHTRNFSDIAWENIEGIALRQNYPNPFNEKTTIEYKIPQKTKVQLRIFNILGQEVKTIVNGIQEEGNYKYVWDATNNFGKAVASDMYIISVKTANKTLLKKMIYLK